MTKEQKEKIMEVLRANELGAVATNSGATPELAVVAVSQTEELELIFATFNDTRKFQNIIKDPRVALVMGWDNEIGKNVQIEGTARLVSEDEREKIEEIHLKKNPRSLAFKNDPRQSYFIVTPQWFRYSNFSGGAKEVWEINV